MAMQGVSGVLAYQVCQASAAASGNVNSSASSSLKKIIKA